MIRTRLAVWNALVLAAVLAVIGTILYVTARASLYRPIDQRLLRGIQTFADDIGREWAQFPEPRLGMPPLGPRGPRRGPEGMGPGPRGPGFGRGMRQPPPPPEGPMPEPGRGVSPELDRRLRIDWLLSRPRVVKADGTGLMYAADEPWDPEAMRSSLAGEVVFAVTRVLDERVRVVSVPVRTEGRVVGVAQAAASLEGADRFLAQMVRTALFLLPVALALTTLAGFALTRIALRPVKQYAEAAERIEATRLGERLPVHGKDEFAALASTFNSMFDRLEAAFRRLEAAYETQRRFVSDASHELKTPLTAIKTRVGIARRGPQTAERLAAHVAEIGVSADAMAAIVGDLLLLARSDEGRLALRRAETPLLALVDEALGQTRPEPSPRIEVDIPADLDVSVDPALFGRVLTNLLSNAFRHTPPEGLVAVAGRRVGGAVEIEVRDTGEGIPAEHLERVFERFHRVDASRDRESGGTGLGLPIAKSLIEAHGGSLTLQSRIGAGTSVRIILPS